MSSYYLHKGKEGRMGCLRTRKFYWCTGDSLASAVMSRGNYHILRTWPVGILFGLTCRRRLNSLNADERGVVEKKVSERVGKGEANPADDFTNRYALEAKLVAALVKEWHVLTVRLWCITAFYFCPIGMLRKETMAAIPTGPTQRRVCF